MVRVFLDANVLFSAAYRSDSGLLALWRRADASLLTSAYAVDEARRNLSEEDQRPRLDALVLTGDRTHFGPYDRRTLAGVLILPPSEYLHD